MRPGGALTSAAKKSSTKKLDDQIMKLLRRMDPKDVKVELDLPSIWRVYNAKRRCASRRPNQN
jgi:hypothetical protein